MTATVSSMSRWMVNCCLGWVLAWVQYSTVQYSSLQYSTVHYSTVQYLALVHPGVPHPQHPHPQLPDAGQGVEVYRVSGVGGEHDGVVAQDVDVVRGSPHPGDLLRSWLVIVCHESKCVHFDAPLK